MSYEDQLSAAKFRSDRDALAQAVQGVCEDMEAHALGVDGMEGAPVTRWDRDLRAALGGMREAIDHAMGMSPNAQRLLQEDEDAAKWVRERGGLKVVMAQHNMFKTVKAERDDFRDSSRRYAHILRDANNRRVELCSIIGIDVDAGWSDACEELRKRLIPDGMEWPRYEDDEPVSIGDRTSRLRVDEIRFGIGDDACTLFQVGSDGINERLQALRPGERVKRPQVIAADGKPLEVGQTVYLTFNGEQVTVKNVEDDKVWYSYGRGMDVWSVPENITHQRPVLDAGGVPIKVGETVYDAVTGKEYEVADVCPDGYGPKFPNCQVRLIDVYGRDLGFSADNSVQEARKLTHNKPEPPDSWERIEEDATRSPYSYCVEHGLDDDGIPTNEKFALDLVSRCKKLAGVSE